MTTKRKKPITQTNDLLIEIGCEELPFHFVEVAAGQLRDLLSELLSSSRITCGVIKTWATPMRLVAHVKNVALKQEDIVREVRGPAQSNAFDEAGEPTKQVLGFAQSQGVKINALVAKETPKGCYMHAIRHERGKNTKVILADILPQLLNALEYSVRMRWESDVPAFPRPLRWCCVLLGSTLLKVTIGGIDARGATCMRQGARLRSYKVSSPANYFSLLKKHGIILDGDERKNIIRRKSKAAAKKCGGTLAGNEGLLTEVAHLAERPKVLAGSFNKKYLDLPPDVLTCSMSKHQRLFTVVKRKKLLPHFIGVLNGTAQNVAGIRRNFEKVLEARLDDSFFFYREDRRSSLEEKMSMLEHLVFHEKLGSMHAKADRLTCLVTQVGEYAGFDTQVIEDARRAAWLAKADLVSAMVKEFPSLQGIMGYYYALADGEPKAVAQAIGEQYMPRTVHEDLPRSEAGTLVALCDKLDTVVGYFGAGLIPSGSLDPYGLRRAGAGVIAVLSQDMFQASLYDMIDHAISLYTPVVQKDPAVWREQLQGFFKERLEAHIAGDYPHDVVNAVFASGCDTVFHVRTRLSALHKLGRSRDLLKAWKVVERTKNILKGARQEIGEVSVDAFEEQLERQLWQRFCEMKDVVASAVKAHEYASATKLYAEAFFALLDEFFDKILVNVDNQVVRNNRLAIMKEINHLYTKTVADLSELVITNMEEV